MKKKKKKSSTRGSFAQQALPRSVTEKAQARLKKNEVEQICWYLENALATGLYKQIHRVDRCDLSLFQLGLRLLTYLAGRGLPIPLPKLPIADDLHRMRQIKYSD